jgi:iron complex outermembrane receptor protein
MIRYAAATSLLGLLIAASGASAQAPDTDKNDIIVLGQGLPLPPGTPAYGAVVIDQQRLENSASGRLENVLLDVAGFQQFRRSDSRSANPSAQGATLRALGGNASSRTLVVLDGVPMADPFFGYIPFNALSPDRLSVVRVTRGGGSGAFGAGAVAGTIELASADRASLPLFSGSALYGSKDATELSASLSPDVGAGFVSLSARWDRGDGFQTTPASQRVAATVPAAYDGWSVNLRAVAPVSDSLEIQARMLVFRDDRVLRFRNADSGSEGQDASVRLISRGPWQLDALAYVQSRNFTNVVISSSTFRKSLDQRNTPSTGVGGKIELRPPVGPNHVLRVGVDSRFAEGSMFEDAYNANLASNPLTARRKARGTQTTAGLFVEDDWTIGNLVLTGGVRADHWSIDNGFFQSISPAGIVTATSHFADRSDWEFSGRGGAVFHLSDGIALRAAGYTGFRLPTLNELYRPFTVFPITTQANAALEPEKLKGFEGGADVTLGGVVKLSVTGFYNRLDNAIANVTIATTPVITRQRQNIEAVIAKGIELAADARFGDISLNASYAYSHSTVDAPGSAFDGFAPAQSPRHAASATLGWAPEGGPSLSATLRYVGKQYEDDLQSDALRDAITLDAFARVPVGHGVSVVGRAENIFNEKVMTRNAAGSIDYGTPRTLWIGVRFEG